MRARRAVARRIVPGRKRVHHASYGEGTVTRVERGGLSLRVLFDRFPGLEVSLPSRLLKLLGDAPREKRADSAADRVREPAPSLPAQELCRRWQVLEALRLGVVPVQGLLAYTVGRDPELEAFRRMIELADGGRALSVLGDYGTGKTHMLELMQHLALEQNWVVGMAWLDPQEAPPSKPRRVYSLLARSLVYPDRREAGACGLLPLLEGSVGCPRSSEEGELDEGGLLDDEGRPHVFLGPALDYARALAAALDEDPGSDELQELQLRLIDWIEGRTTGLSQELQRSLHARLPVRARVLALSDFGTLPRVYGYMLSGLGMLARRRGYEGLLLLLDETELFASLDTESRSRAVDVFRVLLSAALPAQGGRALDLTGVRKGGRGIIRRLPPRFGVRSHLAICLAATPGSSSEVFLRQTLGENRVLELSAFGSREYREMGDRILDLYLAAHPGMRRSVIAGLESRMERWLSGGLPSGPREFARRSVDFLDQCRHTSFDFS